MLHWPAHQPSRRKKQSTGGEGPIQVARKHRTNFTKKASMIFELLFPFFIPFEFFKFIKSNWKYGPTGRFEHCFTFIGGGWDLRFLNEIPSQPMIRLEIKTKLD